MPDINYVCISDTHLGEEDSLFTNLKTASFKTDLTIPSPTTIAFVDCLRDVIEKNEKPIKPTLILCGDILELALATTNEAIMAFERFFELIMPKGKELFDRIIYVPGNHDHHLWEVARETQYINYLKSKKINEELREPWHTTNLFVEKDPRLPNEVLLTSVVQRYTHLKSFEIKTAYPNFGVINKDFSKAIVFNHGHFTEPLYQLMSNAMNLIFPDREKPKTVWDIETENYAWIDFFWSTLGRSGKVGENIEKIYEKLGDKKQLKKLLRSLAKGLAEKYDLPGWGDWMEEKIAAFALEKAADMFGKRERSIVEDPLSKSTEKGLRDYVTGPLYEQIISECKGKMPSDMTIVFGHTHKPFQQDMNFKGYDNWVNVYNTGGWIAESVKPVTIHGGAVVLVDENLDAVTLRMYNETEKPEDYTVYVEEAVHAKEEKNSLYERLNSLIKPTNKPWKTFSEVVARAVYVRAQNLSARINEKL